MLKCKRAFFIVLLSIALGIALGLAAPGTWPAQAQVIHENPAALDAVQPYDVNGKMMLELEHMFGALDLAAYSINASDFDASRLKLKDFENYYRFFKDYLGQTNLTGSEYREIMERADLTAADLRAMINSSEAFDGNMALFEEYWARGDTMNATIAAAGLQGHLGRMDGTVSDLTSSATTIDRLLRNTSVDTNRLNAGVGMLNGYLDRMTALNQLPKSLLGNTSLTLATSTTYVGTGDTAWFTGRLTDNASGAGIAGSQVDLYVEGEPVAAATTAFDGSYTMFYTVKGGSFARTLNAIAYYDPHGANYAPAVSNNVPLHRSPIVPELTIAMTLTTAQFGDTLRVRGTLTADGYPVPGHLVSVYLPGRPGCLANTSDDGSYVSDINITPDVKAGILDVRVGYEEEHNPGDALTDGSSPYLRVIVYQQATTLTLARPPGALRGGENVTFSGALTSANGRPVEGAGVGVYAGDTRLCNGTTDASGRYNISVRVPCNLTAGVWPVYARYSPPGGLALTGSQSSGYDVTFVAAPPDVVVYGIPLVAFPGDRLDLLVNVTANGAPVRGYDVSVDMSGTALGAGRTDDYGNLFVVDRINGSAGLQTITVVTAWDGLLQGAAVNSGFVLVMPFDPMTCLAIAVVILLAAGLAVSRVRGVRRRLSRALKPPKKTLAKPTVAVTPLPGPPAGWGGRPALTRFEDEIARINEIVKGGADRREIIAEIYLAARRIAIVRGIAIADSATHREFFKDLARLEPSLVAATGTITRHYESAVFGHLSLNERDIVSSMYSLKEIDNQITADREGGGT